MNWIMLLLAFMMSNQPRHNVYMPMVYNVPNNKLGYTGNDIIGQRTLGAVWAYSWTNMMSPAVRESVPMLWGAIDIYNVPNVTGSSRWLMGANEPDLDWQANIAPADYAPMWYAIEKKYPDNWLVSPVPSQEHPEWLSLFWSYFYTRYHRKPRIDALAVHCYGNCIEFVQGRVNWAKTHDIKQVWVTEFGFYDTWERAGMYASGSAELEAKRFIAYMDSEPLITRYAPFLSSMGDPAQRYTNPYWWPSVDEDPSLVVWNDYTRLTKYGKWYAR